MSTATATFGRWLIFGPVHPRNRGLFIAICVFVAIFVVLDLITPGPISYFEISFLSAGTVTLALAAMGQTLVILTGGFDLSAGAVISLVNVVLATQMGDTPGEQILFSAVAIGLGALVGAVNGFFVAFLRLQSIVVTLATMFIIQGFTLLVLTKPGGTVPYTLTTFLTGDAIPNGLPAAIIVLVIALLIWLAIKRSRFGTAIYAIGSDEEAARANGIRVEWSKFFAYVAAGAFYGSAGLYISAMSGAGDPLVGNPMLLQIFAAVVLGGTLLGGGRGGCLGTVFAALTLTLIVNTLLILDVSAYYSTLVEGSILILAVLGATLGRASSVATYLRFLRVKLAALADHSAPSRLAGTDRRLAIAGFGGSDAPSAHDSAAHEPAGWLVRNRGTLTLVIPVYAFAVLVIIATAIVFHNELQAFTYINSVMVLVSFLAVLGLGQGAVILSGGLDLSVPWTIALAGIMLTGMASGSNADAVWAIPVVLAVGVAVGCFNGFGVVFLGLPPIVMTLAMNGILQTIALVYTGGTPGGWAPPAVRWFMTSDSAGLTPAAWFLIVFAVAATLLLSRTTFGRRIYAVGNSIRAARLSGVGTGATVIGVYMLSGLCSAIVGVMLTGFSSQAFLGMGDPYFLPSIAVVVVGGTLITGGRGHYVGILGGAILLTVLSTLLAGTTLPFATRDIIYGAVVLGAILVVRERST